MSPCNNLSHFIGLQSALQIIYHHQMLQSRLSDLPFYKKKQKNLQFSTIININLFESKKITSAVIILNKLSVNMHKFLDNIFHYRQKSLILF